MTLFALNVDDVYIVINRGVEIKAKILTMDYHFMFWRLKSLPMVVCSSEACQCNHNEKGHDFLRIREGIFNLWGQWGKAKCL